MRIQIVSCSASSASKGRPLARTIARTLRRAGAVVDVFNLAEVPAQWMSEDLLSDLPSPLKDLRAYASEADAILLVAPIYSYGIASVGKFAAECLGPALKSKPVMLVTTSSTDRSHLAIGSFVFGLIVDWKILFYPNFVQTTGLAEEEEKLRLEASLKGFVDFCNHLEVPRGSDTGGRKPLPFEHLLAHRPKPAVLESIARLGDIAPSLEPFIDNLGNTGLIELPSPKEDVKIFGKCEWENPFGSVKDRTAFALLARLVDEHPEILTMRGEIVEYSGGNLGVALANIAKHLNLPLTVFLSSKSSDDIVEAIESLGGRVRKVPPGGGFLAVMTEAFEYVSQNDNSYLLYQHVNGYNPLVHEFMTGVEISNSLKEMRIKGPISLIASVGTGGTLAGTARALRKHFSEVGIYALSPSELTYGSEAPPNDDPKLAGSGGFGCGLKQPFVHSIESTIAEYVSVGYEEALEAGASLIMQVNEAVSSSGAAAWLSAYRLAETSSRPESYVVILPSRPTASEFEKMQAIASKQAYPRIAQASAGVS